MILSFVVPSVPGGMALAKPGDAGHSSIQQRLLGCVSPGAPSAQPWLLQHNSPAKSLDLGETRLNCVRIARKAACKESKRPLEVSQHSEEMGLILGICAGGLIVLIILLGAIIIVIRKG
ncbi:receptor-type tyrosine-protein phosphatase hypothetical protein [Limosa lapponica baueri]|uniref:Receptor-type tyrosine-protein phosphatase U-like Fn3 domain-containing protein n=1 Tax=Limosa lapponica baueri TaxID=1758121 RepID=A0A2I0T0K0_LIMLA|nr:receptor-type tyrosine-protein phosphatase hypothetical protein [Limosa lapponica baueri]